VNNLVYEAIRNGVLLIYEKDFIRTFIHVRDMVRSFEFALTHADSMSGEIFNVGSSESTRTKEELAKMIQELTNCRLVFADVGEDLDKRNYTVSHDKIEGVGFKTSVSMKRGLLELIEGLSSFRIQTGYSNQLEY
jgi:nucleoside-diphosphate-sugar epimerase